MRSARIAVLAIAAVSVFVSGAAQAASPSSGTLSKTKKSVSWTGSFTLSEPNPLGDCLGGSSDPTCDYFDLKVNLGDGARIRVELPAPSATTDLDLYIYAPNGSLVASSGNLPGENEIAEFRHSGRFKNQVYEVRVLPYLVVPGTAYKAMAKVR